MRRTSDRGQRLHPAKPGRTVNVRRAEKRFATKHSTISDRRQTIAHAWDKRLGARTTPRVPARGKTSRRDALAIVKGPAPRFNGKENKGQGLSRGRSIRRLPASDIGYVCAARMAPPETAASTMRPKCFGADTRHDGGAGYGRPGGASAAPARAKTARQGKLGPH